MSSFLKPVKVGDVMDVEVVEEGDQGDGIAFVEGLAVYVEGSDVGDEVTIRIDRIASNCAFAEPVR